MSDKEPTFKGMYTNPDPEAMRTELELLQNYRMSDKHWGPVFFTEDGNSRVASKRYDSSWKGGLEPGKRALWDSGQHRFVFNVDRWMNYSRQYLHSTGHYVSKKYPITVTRITPKQMRRMKKKWRKNNDTSIVLWGN